MRVTEGAASPALAQTSRWSALGAPSGRRSAQTKAWVGMRPKVTGTPPFFYRTDHHWTSLGAYYGYTCLMDALGRGEEILPLETYTKTIVSTEFYGTVFSSSGVRWVAPDEMDTYVPETDDIVVESHTYDAKGDPVVEPRQLSS